MKEFVFIFRSTQNPHANPSPDEMQQRAAWFQRVAGENKLADKGNRLSGNHAKVVKPGGITAGGPYKQPEEFISGYMVVKTANIDEAINLAKTNPILEIGGTIEIRNVLLPGEND